MDPGNRVSGLMPLENEAESETFEMSILSLGLILISWSAINEVCRIYREDKEANMTFMGFSELVFQNG